MLAAGGLFRGARVLEGRRRPHAAERARQVLEASVEQLNQAEILTRAVCDLSLTDSAELKALRAATGARWWSPTATEGALAAAFGRLRDAGTQWAELESGGTLRFSWGGATLRNLGVAARGGNVTGGRPPGMGGARCGEKERVDVPRPERTS